MPAVCRHETAVGKSWPCALNEAREALQVREVEYRR